MSVRFNRYRRPNGVAVALDSAQPEGDCIAEVLQSIAQYPELRRISVFQNDFQTPVAVEIGKRERAAIVRQVQAHRAGNIRKRAVAIVYIEDISFISAPGGVGSDQLINRVPALLIT